ncbi:zinc-transporting ATPase [Marinithermofilum abyssi]|uniref:Zinc-transporting ATPase n=1 Tax=Marinithermofilum abyssi TaxID=1571185 RepID=A0A8J2YE32_9BACL|nr:heavy metal translocating P-type ATPase [Marinithermofilum abyssi]GGE23654.1 zinc-transporting ATPase [Marinithermofilum abyssi]
MAQLITTAMRSAKHIRQTQWRWDWVGRHGEALAAGVCGGCALLAWWLEGRWQMGAVPLYVLAYVIGGFAKAAEGIRTMVRERKMDVNLLMMLAAGGAASIGHWAEGAVLIFIFALSGAMETYAEQRSHRDLTALVQMRPVTARRLQSDREEIVPIERLRPGDQVLVKPGEQIPTDGIVVEGASAVHQSAITGESVPVDKQAGEEVFTGTLNGEGSLVVQVMRSSEESVFAKMVQLVQSAQESCPPAQRWMEGFEKWYVHGVLLTASAVMLLPPLMLGWGWDQAVYRAMVFLVVASPCAVMASIMPAVLSAMSKGARSGLLFKGGSDVAALSQVRVIAFDKTGTLTCGELHVTHVQGVNGFSEEEALLAAASVERLSEHPIAQAIVREAERRGLALEKPARFVSVTGSGVQAVWREHLWKVGKGDFVHVEDGVFQEGEGRGKEGETVVFVTRDGEAAGWIALQDRIRSEAAIAVHALRSQEIRTVLLTGDCPAVAAAVAKESGVDEWRAGLLPDEKVEQIRSLQQRFGPVAMIGDGVNDAPALAAADASVAMGAAGTDVALETARIVLMQDDLNKITEAVGMARKVNRIVKQNLIFAGGVILLLILANFEYGIPLPYGVVGHEGSTILVILNGLRLLR